jgi:hypothetical protein
MQTVFQEVFDPFGGVHGIGIDGVVVCGALGSCRVREAKFEKSRIHSALQS